MGEITLPVAINGAARTASLFDPGRNCYVATRANRAALLVDAENYFRAFTEAARRATQSIIIVGWDFDSRTQLRWDTRNRKPLLLGKFLNDLVRRRPGLNIYILNWDYPLVFGKDREVRPAYGFGWRARRRVHLRYDNTHPVGASHHQKIVVIDDSIAFSGGLDLTCRRWDTCAHEADDARRTLEGTAYPPFHDAMAAVDGEAAEVLARIARKRWLGATGETIPPVTRADDPWPQSLSVDVTLVDVAVSRTMPKTESAAEVREVEALYLDMIAAAQRYIYIENQYFTSERIGSALAARLAEADPPEIVLVTRLLSHGWLEEHTMHVLRTRLIKQLRAADRRSRFEVYYPHVDGLKDGTCIDCHSKLLVIDDEWLRIGSANLSNRSMGLDSECDLTFEARGRTDTSAAVRAFRDALLAEHLGMPVARVQSTLENSGSIHTTIRTLQSEKRTLRVLEDIPEWSDAAIDLASVADPERPVSLDQLIDEFAPETEAARSGPAWGKLALIALAILALTLAWRHTPLAAIVTAERAIDWARAAGDVWWAPLVAIVAYSPAAFVMFPRPLITLFAVIAFGPWLGFATSMTGIVGAALTTYYAGRILPPHTVRHLAGDKLNHMSEVLRRRGLLAIFAVRIVPVAPFFIEGMVAGAIRIKLWHYVVGTILGMTPGTLTTTVFGDQFATALGDPSQINYWLVAAVVALFAVVIYIVRRWFRAEHRRSQAGAQGSPQTRTAAQA